MPVLCKIKIIILLPTGQDVRYAHGAATVAADRQNHGYRQDHNDHSRRRGDRHRDRRQVRRHGDHRREEDLLEVKDPGKVIA